MHLSLVLFVVVLAFLEEVPAQFLMGPTAATDECQKDSDCGPTAAGGQCCMKVRDPKDGRQYMKCRPLGVVGSVCDLDGQAEDACPCLTGLNCAKIDLSEFGPTAAGVNAIFEKYHFGMCEAPTAP